MGIKCKQNWSGTIVNDVLLGEPALDGATYDEDGTLLTWDGTYHWDGGIPSGFLDELGKLKPEGTKEDGTELDPVDFDVYCNIKVKEIKKDENGDPIPEDHLKDTVLVVDDTFYYATKDTTTVPPHKDWKVVKDSKDKVK